METVDEVYEGVRKDHPNFSLGVIFVGLKFRPLEETEAKLTTALEHKWEKVVGIDFAQQEDPSGSLKRYDEVADMVLPSSPTRKSGRSTTLAKRETTPTRISKSPLKGGR